MSIAAITPSDTNAIINNPVKRPDLRDKAIDIKGKQYVQVSHRIIYFNETYPEGSIVTELISPPDAETVVIKATVWPDHRRQFTGYSQATWGDGYINKTSALENAETSAVGRALAFMGIGVIDSIASVDEVNKATNRASTSGQVAKPVAAAPKKVTKVVAPEPPAQTTPPIATDEDVPALIGDRPTTEQMKNIKARLNGFELDRDALKNFVLKEAGRETAAQLTFQQWNEILAKLDTFKTAGKLSDLLK